LFSQQKPNEFGIGNLLHLNSSCSNISVITAEEIQQQNNICGILQRYDHLPK
jgi:hypothetical protein